MPKVSSPKAVPAKNSTSQEIIRNMIFLIRGKKVMLDSDLALLYGVETKQLKRAVRRNISRFPDDFMFELAEGEYENLRCQIGTSRTRSQNATSSWGGRRYAPLAFTEQGIAMLSSVLNSERAIQVNIEIMRAFTQLRRMLLTNVEIRRKIEDMEKKYDKQFQVVFTALKRLLEEPVKPKGKLGF